MRIRIPHISKEASHYITLEQGFNDYIRDVNKLSVRPRHLPVIDSAKIGHSYSWRLTLQLSRRYWRRWVALWSWQDRARS